MRVIGAYSGGVCVRLADVWLCVCLGSGAARRGCLPECAFALTCVVMSTVLEAGCAPLGGVCTCGQGAWFCLCAVLCPVV